MPRPRRIAAATLIGGSATLSGFYGFLVGEAILARRAIGTTDERPPSPDGIYGDETRRVIRQFQANQKQHHHHTKLGKVHNILAFLPDKA